MKLGEIQPFGTSLDLCSIIIKESEHQRVMTVWETVQVRHEISILSLKKHLTNCPTHFPQKKKKKKTVPHIKINLIIILQIPMPFFYTPPFTGDSPLEIW